MFHSVNISVYISGQLLEGALTLTFVLVPAVIIMLMDISWLSMDYKVCWSCATPDNESYAPPTETDDSSGTGDQEWSATDKCHTKIRIALSLLSVGVLGRIWR